MSMGGRPSERARQIIARGDGIIVCPRLEDWRPRDDKEPLGDECEAPCAVCGHVLVASACTAPLERAGFSLVCTYDAERFRAALGQYVTTDEVEAARGEIKERFARRHGIDAESVVQVLPRELSWLAGIA